MFSTIAALLINAGWRPSHGGNGGVGKKRSLQIVKDMGIIKEIVIINKIVNRKLERFCFC